MISKYNHLIRTRILSLFNESSNQISYQSYSRQFDINQKLVITISSNNTAIKISTNHSNQSIFLKTIQCLNSCNANLKYSFCSSNDKNQEKNQKTNKKSQDRLRILREKQKQQLKAINNKVNLTKGSFSPFFSYLKMHKMFAVVFLCSIFLSYYIFKIIPMIGTYDYEEIIQKTLPSSNNTQIKKHYEVKKREKIVLVSQKYQQQKIGDSIYQIYTNYYKIIENQALTISVARKLKLIQKSISQFFNQNVIIVPINSQQPILVSLPNNKIIISNSLLRFNKFSQKQLQFLVFLTKQLFKQGYHVSTLYPTEITTFWNLKLGANQIKARQIYSRNYLRRQIIPNIQLLQLKLALYGRSISTQEIKQMFNKLKEMNESIQKSGTKMQQQNIFKRLWKYYILVKVQ